MRRHFTLVFAAMTGLLLSSLAGIAAADETLNTEGDFAVEDPAAPAVAGVLLEEAGIDNRYGTGRDGGNFIRDVAQQMGPETDFNGVSKSDVAAYQCAVADFLIEQDAPVTSGTGVLDTAASGATAIDNADGTVTLEINVVDLCGNGIAELDPTSDFYVTDSVLGGTFSFGTSAIPGSEADEWTSADGTYSVALERNVFNSRPAGYDDGWYRMWDIYVQDELVEEALELKTTYWAVGDWKLDLGTSATTYVPRFIIIDEHAEGEITGFFGIGYDPTGNPIGTIEGTIEGQDIYMLYERTDNDSGYTAEFDGTIADDGNSMSGTWSDGGSFDDEPWTMVRQ